MGISISEEEIKEKKQLKVLYSEILIRIVVIIIKNATNLSKCETSED